MPKADPGQDLLEDLYLSHRQSVWALFFAWQHDRERAMDGVQEVFLQAWRHIDELAGLNAPQRRARIYRTARRQIIDQHRHAAVAERVFAPMPEDFDWPDGGAGDPAATAGARERIRRVEAVVRGLPERLRTVLVLATVGDLSGPEIAEVLAIPHATVRSRLSAARRRVRRALAFAETVGNDLGEQYTRGRKEGGPHDG